MQMSCAAVAMQNPSKMYDTKKIRNAQKSADVNHSENWLIVEEVCLTTITYFKATC